VTKGPKRDYEMISFYLLLLKKKLPYFYFVFVLKVKQKNKTNQDALLLYFMENKNEDHP
jgi:hypothetical protein